MADIDTNGGPVEDVPAFGSEVCESFIIQEHLRR